MTQPKRGAAILHSVGEDADPNWAKIAHRDVPKHLLERYWINQWSGKRWPCSDFVQAHGRAELPLTKLGRTPGDPGDAFLWVYQCTSTLGVSAITWIEVTEVGLPGQAEKVKLFVRQHNGLAGKGAIDPHEFLDSLDPDLPSAVRQREMADRVLAAVKKKAGKGQEGGSYRRLVQDYGRGVLIVGLPLWFSTCRGGGTSVSCALRGSSGRSATAPAYARQAPVWFTGECEWGVGKSQARRWGDT